MNNNSIQADIISIIKNHLNSCFDVVEHQTSNTGYIIPVKFVYKRDNLTYELNFSPLINQLSITFSVYYSRRLSFNILDEYSYIYEPIYIINQFIDLTEIPNKLSMIESYCKFINDVVDEGFNNE